jgi:hypothetical protein
MGVKCASASLFANRSGSEVLGRAVFLSAKNPRQKRSFFAPVGRKKKSGLSAGSNSHQKKCFMQTTVRKKRTGRPTKPVKKEIRASVRFTRAEYLVIREKAGRAGMMAAAFLRLAAFQSMIRTRLTEEERQLVRQLVGMSNNLNQTAKTCHKEGALRAMAHFEKYRKDIDDVLKKLRA